MYSKTVVALLLAVCVSQIAAVDERCKNVPNGQFMADFSDCSRYMVCSNGNLLRGQCPEGFLFNEAEQLCDFPRNVQCTVCDAKKGIYSQQIQDDCEQYLLCFNGIAIVQTCAEGLAYNPEIHACDLAEHVACAKEIEEEPLTCPASGLHYISDPSNCHNYYICFHGQISTAAFTCAQGLLFNAKSGACEIASAELFCVSDEDPTRY